MKPVCKKWLSVVLAACGVIVTGAIAGYGAPAAFVGTGLFALAHTFPHPHVEEE